MLPTLRQLQYLKLLNQHGSFSRAAEAAHVTQPTLSAGIAELEKILGAPVVDRARSGVILTAAGEEAVTRAEAILAQTGDLVQAARGAGHPLSGRFRLGVIPTIAPFLLPRALPYDMTGLDYAHVGDDELLAALPSGHALARQNSVSAANMDAEEMILLEDGHCLREHALAACGLEPPRHYGEESFAATSLPTLVQMVGSGLGVSFLPRMAVDAGLAEAADVAVRPIGADHPSREIVVAWRKGSSRAAEGRLLAETMQEAG